MARRALRVASALLIAAGLAMLASMNLSDVVARYEADQCISRAESRYESASDTERAELVRQARLYNEGLAGGGAASSLPYEEQLCFSGEPVMGSVEIPAIQVRLPIYHGTGEVELMGGVGHLQSSSLPVGGPSTHCVLLGHSGMANTRMFDGLEELRIGDVFIVWVLNVAHAYEVYDMQVVLPDEIAANIGIQEACDLTTLVTCTPYGVNSHRLLVHGRRCEYAPLQGQTRDMRAYATGRTIPLGLALTLVAVFACAGLVGRYALGGKAGPGIGGAAHIEVGRQYDSERNGSYAKEKRWRVPSRTRMEGSARAYPGHGARPGGRAGANRRRRGGHRRVGIHGVGELRDSTGR